MTSAPITTAVSGGVFQNALLLGDACVALRPNGFMFCDTVGCHRTTAARPSQHRGGPPAGHHGESAVARGISRMMAEQRR